MGSARPGRGGACGAAGTYGSNLRMRFSPFPRRPKTPPLTSPHRADYVSPRHRTGAPPTPGGGVGDMSGAIVAAAAPSGSVGGGLRGVFQNKGRATRGRRRRGRAAAYGRPKGAKAPPGTPTDRGARLGGAAAAGSAVGARAAGWGGRRQSRK